MRIKLVVSGVVYIVGDRKSRVDPKYFRPTEVDILVGDPAKAKRVLGWVPEITFAALVKEMVEEDIKILLAGGEPGER